MYCIYMYIVFIVLAIECGGDGKLMMDDGMRWGVTVACLQTNHDKPI